MAGSKEGLIAADESCISGIKGRQEDLCGRSYYMARNKEDFAFVLNEFRCKLSPGKSKTSRPPALTYAKFGLVVLKPLRVVLPRTFV
jgi:hypothetical protein